MVRVKASEWITAVINVAALLFVGAQVLLARRALKETGEAQQREWVRRRKQVTIEAVVSTAHYRESLKSVLPWNDRDPQEVAAFLKQAAGDHAKLAPVREYLNHLTDLAVGIKQGVFDLETVSMLEGSRIIGTAESYSHYIADIRRELNNPWTYEDIEELAEMLREQRNGKQ
jgi:hypothetical protein